MKKLTEKLSIVPVLFIAGIPFLLLARGVTGLVKYEDDTPPAVLGETKESPYEVSYCSGETEKVVEFVPEHITIPDTNIDLNVVSVPLENGTWKVFSGVANYAKETSPVNLVSGNVGIYAHNRKNGFLGIRELKEDSAIDVYGGNYVATYHVSKTAIANPSAVDVFYATTDPTLTLVTCDGTFSERRYVLQAKLVSVKEKCDQ